MSIIINKEIVSVCHKCHYSQARAPITIKYYLCNKKDYIKKDNNVYFKKKMKYTFVCIESNVHMSFLILSGLIMMLRFILQII